MSNMIIEDVNDPLGSQRDLDNRFKKSINRMTVKQDLDDPDRDFDLV